MRSLDQEPNAIAMKPTGSHYSIKLIRENSGMEYSSLGAVLAVATTLVPGHRTASEPKVKQRTNLDLLGDVIEL